MREWGMICSEGSHKLDLTAAKYRLALWVCKHLLTNIHITYFVAFTVQKLAE